METTCQLACWQTDGDVYDGTQSHQHHHFQKQEYDKYILLQYVIPACPHALVQELYPIVVVHLHCSCHLDR